MQPSSSKTSPVASPLKDSLNSINSINIPIKLDIPLFTPYNSPVSIHSLSKLTSLNNTPSRTNSPPLDTPEIDVDMNDDPFNGQFELESPGSIVDIVDTVDILPTDNIPSNTLSEKQSNQSHLVHPSHLYNPIFSPTPSPKSDTTPSTPSKPLKLHSAGIQKTPNRLSSKNSQVRQDLLVKALQAQISPQEQSLRDACESGDLDTVINCLKNGVNPNIQDSKHRSPLHIASSKGHLDIVQLLINSGSNLSSRDVNLSTPLHLAVAGLNFNVCVMLLRMGSDPTLLDKSGNSPIHLAQSRIRLLITQLQNHPKEKVVKIVDEVKELLNLLRFYENKQGLSEFDLDNVSKKLKNNVFDELESLLNNLAI